MTGTPALAADELPAEPPEVDNEAARRAQAAERALEVLAADAAMALRAQAEMRARVTAALGAPGENDPRVRAVLAAVEPDLARLESACARTWRDLAAARAETEAAQTETRIEACAAYEAQRRAQIADQEITRLRALVEANLAVAEDDPLARAVHLAGAPDADGRARIGFDLAVEVLGGLAGAMAGFVRDQGYREGRFDLGEAWVITVARVGRASAHDLRLAAEGRAHTAETRLAAATGTALADLILRAGRLTAAGRLRIDPPEALEDLAREVIADGLHTRTDTPDEPTPGGGTRMTLKRVCGRCGTRLGDTCDRDVDPVGNLTDVDDECPTCILNDALDRKAAGHDHPSHP